MFARFSLTIPEEPAEKELRGKKLEARCCNCGRIGEYPVREWSWVRYKGSFRDKMVCPTCRREAEAQGGNIVSPAKSPAFSAHEGRSLPAATGL